MCATCGCQKSTKHHNHNHDHTQNDHQHGVSLDLATSIMAENDKYAKANRQWLIERNIRAVNVVSSPGSGKTSLLVATIQRLAKDYSIAVIEGDQQTSLDAERIRTAGACAIQINTGQACHLDAHGVGHALEQLEIDTDGFVLIENVGNLICPALFQLGEQARVVVLSTTEGDDKPLKYPDMFYHADVAVINKTDLLPYVDFDIVQCKANMRKINAKLKIFELSVKTGAGMDAWCDWLISLR